MTWLMRSAPKGLDWNVALHRTLPSSQLDEASHKTLHYTSLWPREVTAKGELGGRERKEDQFQILSQDFCAEQLIRSAFLLRSGQISSEA